jgi:hypothetical protein
MRSCTVPTSPTLNCVLNFPGEIIVKILNKSDFSLDVTQNANLDANCAPSSRDNDLKLHI